MLHKRKTSNLFLLALLLLLTQLLVACNTPKDSPTAQTKTQIDEHEDDDDDDHDHDELTELAERIVIGFNDQVVIYQTADFTEIATFKTDTNSIWAGPSQRYAFLANRDEGIVKVLDIASWEEDHGDHAHFYAEEPRLLPYEILGGKPTHIVTHHDQTTIFFDESGETRTYDNNSLLGDSAVPTSTITNSAHHGVAVPLANHAMVRTMADGEEALPRTISLFNAKGEETSLGIDLPGLHGEATAKTKNGVVAAFGAKEKIGLFFEETSSVESLMLPDKGARVSSLVGHSNSPYLLANYSSEAEPDLASNLLVVNVETKEIVKVALGGPYSSSFLHNGQNEGYVLGADGNLLIIDLDKGRLNRKIPVIAPVEAKADHHSVVPTMALTSQGIVISEPASSSLLLLDLATDNVTTVLTFEEEPKQVFAPF